MMLFLFDDQNYVMLNRLYEVGKYLKQKMIRYLRKKKARYLFYYQDELLVLNHQMVR